MVWHHDEGVDLHALLFALCSKHRKEELCIGRDLENAAALRSHGCEVIRAKFLWGLVHLGRIIEKPRAKAPFFTRFVQGPEGPCSLPEKQ